MKDFEFLQNPLTRKWVILAPRRAKRPDIAKGPEPVCPFCVGREKDEQEVFRIGGEQNDSNWQVRVLPNKYPFAPVHEIIIHSPDHHKNFDELPLDQTELILQTYRQRYQTYKNVGQVYIFHNRGEAGGESLPHPHTQLAVIPNEVKVDFVRLDPLAAFGFAPKPLGIHFAQAEMEKQTMVEQKHFYIFCPKTSQWPDEVWISPKSRGRAFGEITDEEIEELSFVLSRLLQILDLRHGHEFPFNFYIYPGGDWYLRLIPRVKTLGGFEIGTGVYINTQDPKETVEFIRTHFEQPDEEKIKKEHQAEYTRTA